MKKIAEIVSYLSLVLVIGAPLLFYAQAITLEKNIVLMNIATVVWFVSATCWMGRKKEV